MESKIKSPIPVIDPSDLDSIQVGGGDIEFSIFIPAFVVILILILI